MNYAMVQKLVFKDWYPALVILAVEAVFSFLILAAIFACQSPKKGFT